MQEGSQAFLDKCMKRGIKNVKENPFFENIQRMVRPANVSEMFKESLKQHGSDFLKKQRSI